MTDPTGKVDSGATREEPEALGPSQAEIDAWAERERQRRETWLKGPTEDERAEYARRVRQRRLADAFDEGESKIEDGVRLGVHYGRETQLAAEGAATVFYHWWRRTFAELVRAGREWEEETSLPNRRRRIRLDDEDS
jgi:hypothetical protein